MGQVVVKVNGREFALNCEDGQEPRIRRLGQYIDSKVADFVKDNGQVGEARLILLAALIIADELSDANEALQRERSAAALAGGAGGAGGGGGGGANIRGIAQRVDSIASRLESS